MGERKREGMSPPALGGSSLLVVFAVLALTVFALLSLSTVQADARLADVSAQSAADYYAADCAAQEILARLRNGERPADAVPHLEDSWHIGARYTYAVPISGTQELQAEVILYETDYEILRWQAVPVGEWEPDDSLNIWGGDEDGLTLWDGEEE